MQGVLGHDNRRHVFDEGWSAIPEHSAEYARQIALSSPCSHQCERGPGPVGFSSNLSWSRWLSDALPNLWATKSKSPTTYCPLQSLSVHGYVRNPNKASLRYLNVLYVSKPGHTVQAAGSNQDATRSKVLCTAVCILPQAAGSNQDATQSSMPQWYSQWGSRGSQPQKKECLNCCIPVSLLDEQPGLLAHSDGCAVL